MRLMTPPPSPVEHATTCRCERCGRMLPTVDAVCAPCETELAAPAVDHPRGRYRCPACSQAFVRPDFTLVPAQARWYVPQSQALCCPHCHARLLDRLNPKLPAREAVALIALALGAQFLLPARQIRPALVVLVLVFLGLQLARRPWRLPDALRYERDGG